MMYLAKFISIILGPVILWPILLLILMVKTGQNINTQLLLSILLLFQFVIPFGGVLLAYKKKKIHDLDLTKRSERYIPLTVILLCLIISLPLTYYLGNQLLFRVFLLLTFLAIINGLITLFWKISFHMALNIVFIILINYFYHWSLPILIIFLPLIFWSRLTLKKHSFNQLIASLLLNGAITLLFLKYASGL